MGNEEIILSKPPYKRFWFYGIVAIIVLLVLISIIYFLGESSIQSQLLDGKHIYDNMEECIGVPTTDCYKQFILERGDISICREIDDPKFSYDNCVTFLALSQKNLSLCDFVSEQEIVSCKNSVLSHIANVDKDYEYCLRINETQDRDFCLRIVLFYLKDRDLCTLIVNDSHRDWCLSAAIQTEAEASGNYSLCYEISPELISGNPYNRQDCFWNIAVQTGDKAACEEIEDKRMKGMCITDVLELSLDYESCFELEDGGYSIDNCLYDIAIRINDLDEAISVCRQRSEVRIQDWCVMEVSVRLRDDTYCSGLTHIETFLDTTTDYKESCFERVKVLKEWEESKS